MELLDPATGQTLPPDAIQRVLFVANAVHVYNIPPLTSTKGYNAASWTTDPKRHIFTARLRVIETAYESLPTSASSSASSPSAPSSASKLKVDAVLEDPSSGGLFAAAPYTSAAAVEPVLDSSRFFALMVRDPQGRKAVLGVGFEERSEAFDLSIALQEARKSLGWEQVQKPATSATDEKKDYSLKEGETITVNFGGGKLGRRKPQQSASSSSGSGAANLQSFALPPPPPGPSSGGFSLPPPPSAHAVKQQKQQAAKEMGFDDGQFGEFA